MARIRTVKPDFFRHSGLFHLETEVKLPIRVAFAGLFTVADREGRFRWRPAELKLDCLPYDLVDFARVLDALRTRGFIAKYTVAGEDYGWIPSFLRHQVINNRESPSTLPEPPNLVENLDLFTPAAPVAHASPTRHGLAQAEGEGEGNKKRLAAPAGPAELAPVDFSPAPEKARPRKPLWDAVCLHFHLNPQTSTERSRLGRIDRDLKAKGATPEDIPLRMERYRLVMPPGTLLTPEALLKHWDTLNQPTPFERSQAERTYTNGR